jgi:DnaD/phage-associated family protein
MMMNKEGGSMAEKRMFAKSIIDSDLFLDMPVTAQLLYFHLCMRADDDGFVNNPKRIMRDVRCGDDDLKVLIAKEYIIPFESGVLVIRHWRVHNWIRGDRFKQSVCEERNLVKLNKNKVYELCMPSDIPSDIPNGIPLDIPSDTLEEKRIEEYREEENRVSCSGSSLYEADIAKIHQLYEQGISLGAGAIEYNKLDSLVDEYTAEYVEHAIKAAVYQNKRSLNYVAGILKNWKRDGVPKPWEQKKKDEPDDYGLKIY